MKKIIKKIRPFYKLLAYIFNQIIKLKYPPKTKSFFNYLKLYSEKYQNIFFIQIGANDGVKNDPLNRFIINENWEGILIEPVKKVFERLKINYQGYSNLYFENVAISDKEGKFKFYSLDEKYKEYFFEGYDQISSFDFEHLLKFKSVLPNIENFIKFELIKAIRFQALISKYNIKKINILHLDVEGHEYKILSNINFELYDIDMLLFEHRHFNNKEYVKILKKIKKSKFKCIRNFNGDTLAIRIPVYKVLSKRIK